MDLLDRTTSCTRCCLLMVLLFTILSSCAIFNVSVASALSQSAKIKTDQRNFNYVSEPSFVNKIDQIFSKLQQQQSVEYFKNSNMNPNTNPNPKPNSSPKKGLSLTQSSLQPVDLQQYISNSNNSLQLLWRDILGPKRLQDVLRLLHTMKVKVKEAHAHQQQRGGGGNSHPSSPSSCFIDIIRLLIGVSTGKAWAGSFIDASGKPGPSLTMGWVSSVGNYDQCKESEAPPLMSLEAGFRGQYCNLPLRVSIAPFPLNMGVCVPSSCSSDDLTSFFQNVLSLFNVTAFWFDDVQCLKSETEVTVSTVIAIVILSVLGSLAVIGTYYDVFVVRKEKGNSFKHIDLEGTEREPPHHQPSSCSRYEDEEDNERKTPTEQEEDPSVSVNETKPVIQQTQTQTSTTTVSNNNGYSSIKIKLRQFLLAFSFYTNGKKLLNTAMPEGSIRVIPGIRFLSTSWVAIGHTFIFGGAGYAVNFPTALQTLLPRWTFLVVVNCLLAVDTFFTLSGLLVSYITMKTLWSRGPKGINWLKFYFHRYWRLTPPYLCVLVVVLGLQQYLGEGPLWGNVQPYDREYCEKNWWTNLLYVHNIVDPTHPCFVHSWYLAAEMQFILISPVMLIALWYSRTVGVVCCSCVLVTSWTITGVSSVYYGWGVTVMSAAQNHWYERYYTVPWTRVGPYVIGILTGYLLASKDGKPFRIRRRLVAVGWIIATASALAVVYGIDGYFMWSGEVAEEGNASVKALYNTLSRSAWAACVAWVVVACTAGYGGPVTALLSWSPLTVLGRLTFMTYLIHIAVLNVFFGNMGSLYFLNDTTFAVLYLGVFFTAIAVALVCALLFEWPMTQLEKVFLPQHRKVGQHRN